MTVLKKTLLALFVAITFIVVFIVVWVVLRWNAPPMHLALRDQEVTIDVATLGEYPTSVNRIRLSDSNNQIVWEAVAQNGDAQIYSFVLKSGENPVELDADHGAYRVIAPRPANKFVLTAGARYRIELWGRGKSFLGRRSAVFTLSG